MKILITGASGFIGTNVLDYFSSKAEVVNIDILSPRNPSQMKYWKKLDITDEHSTIIAFKEFNPDYIIHLAARTDLDGNSLTSYEANISGVQNVLNATKYCPKLKKILITSSMLVCKAGYMPKNQTDYCPTTWYGKSKVETERITWSNKPSCDWAILRPTSMWGAWFGVPYRNFFDMVKKNMYFHIGHTACTKTYGYIENAVYQIEQLLFADTNDENNKVFYLGDNPPIFIEEWANQIAHELGFKVPRVPFWIVKCGAWFGDLLGICGIHFPMTSFRLKNMSTDNIVNLDNTYKIAPNPPVDRITGIKRTLEWMKEH